MVFELNNESIGRGRILGFGPANTVYIANKHDLLEVDLSTGKNNLRKSIPVPFGRRLCGYSRLWCRLMRHEIRSFGSLSDGTLIAATRSGIYRAGKTDCVMQRAKLPRLSRTIHLPMTLTVDTGSRVLWGEYWGNSERDEVNIFCSEDKGLSYEPVKTFAKGQVRHIHTIVQDPFGDDYFVMTGDEDSESGIGRLSADFKNFDWLIHGSQQYRAVVVFVLKDRIIYATDTEKDYNFIYSCDRATGKTEKICDIPGSCIYGCRFGKWYVISTTVENFRKFKTNLATLWISEDGIDWQQVWQVEKDIWSKKYFQYGSIVMPRVGWDRDEIVFSGQALKGIDNKVIIAHITE